MRILILCFIFFAQNIFAQNDTIWYNNNWEKTNKISAEFFRPTPKKLANGKYEIIDYYKNGIKQMEGISDFPDREFFNGNVIHYYENGNRQLLTPYENNIIEGIVTKYRENGDVDFETPMKNNLQDGTQILYYPNGKIMAKLPFKDGKEHGIFVKFDENGKPDQNVFYINGKKIDNRTEFNEKFYNNTKTEKTSFGSIQVVNLDDGEKEEPSEKKNVNTEKIEDLATFMDFYEAEKGYLGVTKMFKTIDGTYFGFASKSLQNIVFTIHKTNDGLYVMETYEKYEPKKNEIAFLYELPEKNSFSSQKVYFKLGKDVKSELKNNQKAQLEIVKFLEHKIFGIQEFSGTYAFKVLEDELK